MRFMEINIQVCPFSLWRNLKLFVPLDILEIGTDEVHPWRRGKKESDLKERLERYRQIKLTHSRPEDGQRISNPVWFVSEDEKLYLLPVHSSDTQWYRNMLKNPSIRVDAR